MCDLYDVHIVFMYVYEIQKIYMVSCSPLSTYPEHHLSCLSRIARLILLTDRQTDRHATNVTIGHILYCALQFGF